MIFFNEKNLSYHLLQLNITTFIQTAYYATFNFFLMKSSVPFQQLHLQRKFVMKFDFSKNNQIPYKIYT